MPFVVRREDGLQDRDRYAILTLFRPGRPWRAWAPQRQWNHKLLITHGGNCGASYTPGDPRLQDYSGTLESVPGVRPSYVAALGRGFAVASTALANTGHNCGVAMEAESLMMVKERLVERYASFATRSARAARAARSRSTPSPTPTPGSTRGWSPPAPTPTR